MFENSHDKEIGEVSFSNIKQQGWSTFKSVKKKQTLNVTFIKAPIKSFRPFKLEYKFQKHTKCQQQKTLISQ